MTEPQRPGDEVERYKKVSQILDEDAESIEENAETGKYWDCPHCWWEGSDAKIEPDDLSMRCPECGEVIDDRLKRIMEVA